MKASCRRCGTSIPSGTYCDRCDPGIDTSIAAADTFAAVPSMQLEDDPESAAIAPPSPRRRRMPGWLVAGLLAFLIIGLPAMFGAVAYVMIRMAEDKPAPRIGPPVAEQREVFAKFPEKRPEKRPEKKPAARPPEPVRLLTKAPVKIPAKDVAAKELVPLFEEIDAAQAKKDEAALAGLIDGKRFVAEVLWLANLTEDAHPAAAKAVDRIPRDVAKAMIDYPNAWKWSRFEILKVVPLPEEEAQAVTRLRMPNETRIITWWLTKRSGEWRVYDMAQMFGIRCTIALSAGVPLACRQDRPVRRVRGEARGRRRDRPGSDPPAPRGERGSSGQESRGSGTGSRRDPPGDGAAGADGGRRPPARRASILAGSPP